MRPRDRPGSGSSRSWSEPRRSRTRSWGWSWIARFYDATRDGFPDLRVLDDAGVQTPFVVQKAEETEYPVAGFDVSEDKESKTTIVDVRTAPRAAHPPHPRDPQPQLQPSGLDPGPGQARRGHEVD